MWQGEIYGVKTKEDVALLLRLGTVAIIGREKNTLTVRMSDAALDRLDEHWGRFIWSLTRVS